MICPNCGSNIPDVSMVCPNCGKNLIGLELDGVEAIEATEEEIQKREKEKARKLSAVEEFSKEPIKITIKTCVALALIAIIAIFGFLAATQNQFRQALRGDGAFTTTWVLDRTSSTVNPRVTMVWFYDTSLHIKAPAATADEYELDIERNCRYGRNSVTASLEDGEMEYKINFLDSEKTTFKVTPGIATDAQWEIWKEFK